MSTQEIVIDPKQYKKIRLGFENQAPVLKLYRDLYSDFYEIIYLDNLAPQDFDLTDKLFLRVNLLLDKHNIQNPITEIRIEE